MSRCAGRRPRSGRTVPIGLPLFGLAGTWRSSPIKMRFSRPVKRWSTAANCPVELIDPRTSALCVAKLNPFTVATPPSARSNVVKMLMTVVLPAPLGPSRAKTAPRATLKSMPSSTTLLPKDLRKAFTSIAGPASVIFGPPGGNGALNDAGASGPEDADVAEIRPGPDLHRWSAGWWWARCVQAVEHFAPRGLKVE